MQNSNKRDKLTLEIGMWFGSVNEETYVHGCADARPLSNNRPGTTAGRPELCTRVACCYTLEGIGFFHFFLDPLERGG